MAVTAYLKVGRQDFERIIPVDQTGVGISPVKLKVDNQDISQQLMGLEVAGGVPSGLRHTKVDKQDQEAMLIVMQNIANKRTATVSIATPAVVTLASHGWQVGQGFAFLTTGALPTGITAGQTYYIISTGFGAGAFQFSATKGGAAVNTSGTQSGTQSVYAV